MTMGYILILVIAAIFALNLQIALYPSADMPVIGVSVSFDEDMDPDLVESQLTKRLENSLTSVTGLDTMTSQTSASSLFVILEFDYGTDLDEAKSDVDDIVSRLASRDSYPDWADTPTVMKFDMSSSTMFMRLILTGPGTDEETYNYANDVVSSYFLRIEGVSQVSVSGASTNEYRVEVDPLKLEAYGIPMSSVLSAVSASNVQGSGGSLTENGYDYQISLDARYRSIEEIEETVITTINGYRVRIKDIGKVVVTEPSGGRQSYRDGEKVIRISLSNESDANATTVAKAVYADLPDIQASLPEGYSLYVDRDETEMISSTISEVYSSAVEGVLLAALVIFFFLRSIKPTIIISLSMPVSILVTLGVMALCDITVNVISMAGLILGIGMLVDASIVILENTVKYREKGWGSAASAILGSHNMMNAIVASTLTTICVFVPLIIYKNKLEMIGQMMQDLIYTVCISLGVSLVVAVTLVPALSGSILKINTRTQKPLKNKLLKALDDAGAAFENFLEDSYVKLLDFFLNRRLLLIVLLILLLIISIMGISSLGMQLTPSMDTDDNVSFSLKLPSGTTQDVTREEIFRAYGVILDTLPSDAYTSVSLDVGSSNSGSVTIYLPDITEQKYSATDVRNMVLPAIQGNPDATWTYGSGRNFSSSAISVEVKSNSSEKSLEACNEIAAIIDSYVPEATNVSTDLSNGSPKVNVEVDKELASDLGVSMSEVSNVLAYALAGKTATQLTTFSDDTTYNLKLWVDESFMDSVSAVGSLLVNSNSGLVRLDSIAELSEDTAPMTIRREDKQRVNRVTASAVDGYPTSAVQASVDRAIEEHYTQIDGVTITQNGDMQQFSEYMPTFVMIIVLALVLVYAVMAAQFESLMDPFIIFATIPLLMIGVVAIHKMMGMSFSMFSLIGIVSLIGTVVNNGIVMVDTINGLVAKKLPVYDCCLAAAKTRLRPILMTTLTTVLGMVPMAFFPGDGGEMMQPIAVTFLGGIMTGAFLTLLLTPVLYSIVNTRREKRYNNPESLQNQLIAFDERFPNGNYDV